MILAKARRRKALQQSPLGLSFPVLCIFNGLSSGLGVVFAFRESNDLDYFPPSFIQIIHQRPNGRQTGAAGLPMLAPLRHADEL
jgi:hypothetical protein